MSIKTLGGSEVIIVGGTKKSITGNKPFVVRMGYTDHKGRNIKYKLTRSQLVYDDEQELYDALKLQR